MHQMSAMSTITLTTQQLTAADVITPASPRARFFLRAVSAPSTAVFATFIDPAANAITAAHATVV